MKKAMLALVMAMGFVTGTLSTAWAEGACCAMKGGDKAAADTKTDETTESTATTAPVKAE